MRISVLLTAVFTFQCICTAFANNKSVSEPDADYLINPICNEAGFFQSVPVIDEYVFLITDARDKQIITNTLLKIKDKNNQDIEVVLNSKTGEWKAKLDKTKSYFVTIEAQGYDRSEIEIDAVDQKKIVRPIDRFISLSLKKNDSAPLALSAIDAITLETIPASFRVIRPEETTLTGKSDKENPYKIEIAPKKKFTIEITAEGYKPYTEQLSFESIRTEYPGANITMKRFPLKRENYNFLFRIVDKDTKEFIINTRMRIINLKTRQSIAARIEKDGFSANLSPDAEYSVEVESEGYTQTNQNVDLKELISRRQFAQDIILEKKTSNRYRLIVVDEETKRNIPGASLNIFNATNEVVPLQTTNVQSEWQAILKIAENYTAEVKSKGYITYNAPLVKDSQTLYLKLARVPFKETYFIATDFYTKSVVPAGFKLSTDLTPVKGILDAEKNRYKASLSADKIYEIEISAPGYQASKTTVNPSQLVDNVLMIALKKNGYIFTFNTLDFKTRAPIPHARVSFVASDNDKLALMENSRTTTPIAPADFGKKYTLLVHAYDYKLYTADINLLNLASGNFSFDVLLEKVEIKKAPQPVENKPKNDAPVIVKNEEKTVQPNIDKVPEPVTPPKQTIIAPAAAFTDNYFKSIEIGKPIKLENVFFDQSQPIIKPQSYTELDKLVQMLKENPKVNIEIIGHTDNVGDPRLNLYLSELRAKAVSNYLFNKGVSASRMTSSGKGQQQPVAPNDTEETRQKNRRVEFKVISN
ncbi:OmpA family protein [Emticicia sp. TH156]|uniref:OmpA family protein n=1 Tax=Emticicia sp. TH156 TaxID=2067454 RepID=UPI000C77C3A0|nr:OmpA family protein [Emticicia sp. TH156]PLK42884.1 hypothetical protein C0V77_18400 [Emticicia sp. TH156]